jgi:hypothetical protein
MDPILIGVITVFALLIGGLILYSNRQAARGFSSYTSADSFLDTDAAQGDTMVRLQLDELLAGKGVVLAEGGPGAFEYVWPVKERYESLLKDNPAADAPDTVTEQKDSEGKVVARQVHTSEAGKSQQRLLLERAMELARYLYSFETRVAMVQAEYEGAAPSNATVHFLNGVAQSLREETAKVQTEASRIKPGWGGVIMQQAMQLSVGLEKRREAREAAEAKEAADKRAAALAAEDAKRTAEEDKKRAESSAQADAKAKALAAEKAYKELEKELEKEGGKGKAKGSQKK